MHSRRSVLSGCGALIGSAALAGCGMLDSGGGEGRSAYTDWLFVPDSDVASFSTNRYADVAAVDGLPSGMIDDQVYGVPAEDVDRILSFETNTLFEGSFEPDTVRVAVEDEQDVSLEADGEYGGFQRYSTDDRNRVVCLQEGVAIVTQPRQLGLGSTFVASDSHTYERLIDAEQGDEARLVDENDDFDVLTRELGDEDSVSGGVQLASESTNAFQGARVATGQTAAVGSERTEFTRVVVYETEDDVDEESVRSTFEDVDRISDVSSSTRGRSVTVTFTRQTSELA